MSSLTRKERILACGIEISLLLHYEHTKTAFTAITILNFCKLFFTEPIRAHWYTAHFLVNFTWLGVHTNSFPGLKAVMTSF